MLAVLARRRTLRRHDRWTPAQLRAHQDRALGELRRWATRRSVFYRRFHAGRSDRPLVELPVLTKAAVMEHFDEISTRPEVRLADLERYLSGPDATGLFRGRWFVCATAGTTGRRGVFVWDRREWVQVLASYNRAFDWAGSTAGLTHRVSMAVVGSTNPSHRSARVGASVHSRWVPHAAHRLRRRRRRDRRPPEHRATPGAGRLRLDAADVGRGTAGRTVADRPAVRVLRLGGPHRRHPRAGRQAWTIRPFNVYGATETSGVAADCDRHPGMHLFEDLVLTEVVDEHHRPVPAGTFGAKVLVTVLFSRTLPLIRYEMSDSVRLAADQRCGCGRPYRLLDAIQGREQDALRFPGLDGTGSRVVQPIVFHHVMDDVAAAGWQIAQRDDGHLDVLLARPREVDPEALAARLRSALTARGAVAPAVRIQTVDAIPRTPLGKAPLIVGPTAHTPIGFTWMPSRGTQVGREGRPVMAGYIDNKDALLKRLRRVEGQVRGLQRMVESDTYCIDVLTQVSAATKALQAVALELLDDHLAHCVADAAREGGVVAQDKVEEASAAIARLVRS